MAVTSSPFFSQWPDQLSVDICDGQPNTIDLGSVTATSETQQLEKIGVQIFKRGLQPGVSMVVKAYRSTTLIATSASVNVSDIEAAYDETDNFYGWVRFSFEPRVNLVTSTATRFELELSNYSFDETSTWIAAVKDWPVTMGYASSPGQINGAIMALELWGRVPNR